MSRIVIYDLQFSFISVCRSVCACWKALAGDTALAADITDQFLRLMNTTPLLNDDTTGTYRDRPRVAALLPFAVSKITNYSFQIFILIITSAVQLGKTVKNKSKVKILYN